jgi:hypothetical protein
MKQVVIWSLLPSLLLATSIMLNDASCPVSESPQEYDWMGPMGCVGHATPEYGLNFQCNFDDYTTFNVFFNERPECDGLTKLVLENLPVDTCINITQYVEAGLANIDLAQYQAEGLAFEDLYVSSIDC